MVGMLGIEPSVSCSQNKHVTGTPHPAVNTAYYYLYKKQILSRVGKTTFDILYLCIKTANTCNYQMGKSKKL